MLVTVVGTTAERAHRCAGGPSSYSASGAGYGGSICRTGTRHDGGRDTMNSTASATLSAGAGVSGAGPPRATQSLVTSDMSPSAALTISDVVGPTRIELTRMPWGRSSAASVRENVSRPPLVAE